jgi:hypothetical protein
MKIVFLPAASVLLAGLAGYALLRPPRRARAAAMWAGCALAFGAVLGPFVAGSIAATGLPLSPLPVSVLGIELGRAVPEVAWLMDRSIMRAGDLEAELRALARLFASPASGREIPTALVVLPLCAALAAVVTSARAQRAAISLLLAAALADLISFYGPGLTAVRMRWPETSSRFLLGILLVAVALSVSWTRRAPRAARVYLFALRASALLLLLAYARVGWSDASTAASAGLLAACCAYAFFWWATRASTRPIKLAARVLLGLFLLGALDLARGALRYTFMRDDYVVHPNATFWVDAAQALDDPQRPRRIAVTGGPSQDMDRWFSYAFFGRKLQNRVLYVSPLADGRVGHYGGPDAQRDFAARSDPRAWLRRLRAAGVTHVVTFDPISVERMIMDGNPHLFERTSPAELAAFGAFELRP